MAPWTERADAAGGSGTSGLLTDGMLTVNVTSGTWGSKVVAGTWDINYANFWTDFADAAISMHVGGNPSDGVTDHFIWLVTQGETSGTWSYNGGDPIGGGLSNLKLYSSGTGNRVPDGGATLALLGIASIGLAGMRRRMR
jgi:hypothetical protein